MEVALALRHLWTSWGLLELMTSVKLWVNSLPETDNYSGHKDNNLHDTGLPGLMRRVVGIVVDSGALAHPCFRNYSCIEVKAQGL